MLNPSAAPPGTILSLGIARGGGIIRRAREGATSGAQSASFGPAVGVSPWILEGLDQYRQWYHASPPPRSIVPTYEAGHYWTDTARLGASQRPLKNETGTTGTSKDMSGLANGGPERTVCETIFEIWLGAL